MPTAPTKPPRDAAEIAALVHALEVHQAELEVQNHELAAANDELRATNAALALARDGYHALHELAPAALVTVDPGGTILDINRAAVGLLRTPAHHLIGRRFALFVAEAQRAEVPSILRALFDDGALRAVALILAHDGAPPVEVEVDAVTLPDDGRTPRAVLALVDVTARMRVEAERRLIEQRADEARRHESLGVLAGGIAHDFNNLLTVVLGGTDHALRGLGATSPFTEVLSEVRNAARQAGALAHQMLAYAGQHTSQIRPVDIGELLGALGPTIQATAKVTPLSIHVPDALPWIVGDAAQLRQVVHNLVVNAAEAMVGRPGRIEVTSHAEILTAAAIAQLAPDALVPGRHVVIEVRDDGVGMEPEVLARIFEPYFSTKSAGRGLGLAVVQGIVRGHGGAITVASTTDRGTTVRVYLPGVDAAVADARTTMPLPLIRRAAGAILVVDDDLHVQRVIARIVRKLGFQVWTASGGVDALEVYRAAGARIDLVLLDLTMPDMDGVAVAAALHALRADLPIVLLTGYGELSDTARVSFAATLAKPFDLDDIRQLLDRLLPQAAAPTE